ncbi:MAG: hypothetical protein GY694_16345 [Gammaproteobacteria bacterium]|nr:hypothetical protein [Gammaproteobacteria bacterium]
MSVKVFEVVVLVGCALSERLGRYYAYGLILGFLNGFPELHKLLLIYIINLGAAISKDGFTVRTSVKYV